MSELDELKDRPFIPIGFQLLLFFLLWFMGTYMGELLFAMFVGAFQDVNPEEVDWNQVGYIIPRVALHNIFGLLMPVLYFKRITRRRIWEFVKVHFKLSSRWLLISGAVLVVGLYVIEVLADINEPLKDYLGDGYFIEMQENLYKMHETLFYHDSVGQYLLTLVVFAALPALVEEIIFRGILFGKLMETSNHNLHFSAIVSGLLFAAIHQQPLNLLPIAAMGIGLAYLYHYSKNLSYTILVHFLINAIQISAVFFTGGYRLY